MRYHSAWSTPIQGAGHQPGLVVMHAAHGGHVPQVARPRHRRDLVPGYRAMLRLSPRPVEAKLAHGVDDRRVREPPEHGSDLPLAQLRFDLILLRPWHRPPPAWDAHVRPQAPLFGTLQEVTSTRHLRAKCWSSLCPPPGDPQHARP